MKIEQGLYPIIRRVRRPLIPTDAGTAAPAVVPAKTIDPIAPNVPPTTQTKSDAVPSETND
ncbi:MAG: hypothetical protein ACXWDN_02910 [Limisphaerales bacterium]